MLVLGFGWFKSTQNRQDRLQQKAWRDQFERLQVEAQKESSRITKWLRQLDRQGDARQTVLTAFADDTPMKAFDRGEDYDEYQWEIQRFGIHVQTAFHGDRLVSHGLNFSSPRLIANHPKPLPISYTHWTEGLRLQVTNYAGWIWLAILASVILVRRWRVVGAELMLMIALLAGVAWAVAPNYSMTVSGVMSNDFLFYGLVMYVFSFGVLAKALATDPNGIDIPLRGQFRLRTLLGVTCIVGVLLGLGPFGYFSLIMVASGSVVFLTVYSLHRLPTFSTSRATE